MLRSGGYQKHCESLAFSIVLLPLLASTPSRSPIPPVSKSYWAGNTCFAILAWLAQRSSKPAPNVLQRLPSIEPFRPHVVVISAGTHDTVSGSCQNWKNIARFPDDYAALLTRLAKLPTQLRIVLCAPTAIVLQTPKFSGTCHLLHRLNGKQRVVVVDVGMIRHVGVFKSGAACHCKECDDDPKVPHRVIPSLRPMMFWRVICDPALQTLFGIR